VIGQRIMNPIAMIASNWLQAPGGGSAVAVREPSPPVVPALGRLALEALVRNEGSQFVVH